MSYAPARLLFIALPSSLLLTVALACHRPSSQVTMTRQGGDILVTGDTTPITDSVLGDVIVAGGTLRFSGASGGDYLGAGGSQMVGGRIHGSIRAAGGEIHVTATVDRNATLAGGRIELERSAVVERNAYIAGGDINIAGTIRQSLRVMGGTVLLDGPIGGNVEVNASELSLGPHATITGNLRYRVAAQRVHIDPSARVMGTTTVLPVHDWGVAGRAFRFVWLLGFLVAGIVMVALFPHIVVGATEVLRARPGFSVLVGIVGLIFIPIIAVLIAVTLIGIPLALLIGAMYFVLAYLSRIVPALWFGQMVLGMRTESERWGNVIRFLIGGIILVIFELIPQIGSFVMLVVTIFGFGALLLRVWPRSRMSNDEVFDQIETTEV